jgi:hypothetical protein
LVLTYNLWRNYSLSTFFEYIFLFVQGREKSQRILFLLNITDLLLLWAISKYSKKGKSNDKSTPLYGIFM